MERFSGVPPLHTEIFVAVVCNDIHICFPDTAQIALHLLPNNLHCTNLQTLKVPEKNLLKRRGRSREFNIGKLTAKYMYLAHY